MVNARTTACIAADRPLPDRIWTAQERLDNTMWIARWVHFEHEHRYLFASRYVRGKTVVDCACGAGFGARRFAESGADKVIGIDQSLPNVGLRQPSESCDKVSFVQGDANAIPLPDCAADVFISLETIEHLERASGFLGEVCRVLRSDGVFIVSTPNRTVTNPGKTLQDKPWNQYHVREYNKSEFLDLLGHFFSQVELFGQNRVSGRIIGVLARLGSRVSGHAAVRIRQVLKLPWLLFDRSARHEVQADVGTELYEYLVAVCRAPRIAPNTGTGGPGSQQIPYSNSGD